MNWRLLSRMPALLKCGVYGGQRRQGTLTLLMASVALLTFAACGAAQTSPHIAQAPSPTLAPTSTATATATSTATATATATQRPRPRPTSTVALPPPPHGPANTPTPQPPPTNTPGAGGTATTTPGGSPTPTSTPSCPTYSGAGASMAQVKAALAASAGTPFWSDQPSIILPAPLLDALAWEESGWQSTIIACDGGIGTMQMMPATATWMNQRFGTNWDVNTLSGNTNLGAEYVEWLVRYFGDVYYNGSYDLSNQDLLNDIIAAYNAGPAAIDPTAGTVGIPNWQYVNNVEALMTSCPCLSF